MRFVGIDLAWGWRATTGVAVLDEAGQVVDEQVVRDDQDILDAVAAHDAFGAVVAFDAPLVVRNATGRRPCEGELERRYGSVGAGPYPSNLRLLRGRVRAMELTRALAHPYLAVPRDPGRATGWWAVEVFPHPALVELGRLERALRYKRGPAAGRAGPLGELFALLQGLAGAEPALRLAAGGRLCRTAADLGVLRGQARKAFEDLADAHVCAYVGLWWWWHGPARTLVAGDDEHGAILVPQPAWQRLTGP
jgi:predicted RNase H-like nuclease